MIKRLLLKLSGEQFAGKSSFGIDPEFVTNLAEELADVVETTGVQIVVVVGGGNFIRGAKLAAGRARIERATADYMGMLATVINGMALVDILESSGQPARLQARVMVHAMAEPYIRRKAIRHLEKGRVVVMVGGTGNPYVTTDTAAVSAALELGCEVVLKATKVDGVYSSDPKENPKAKKFSRLTHLDALKNKEIKVMDNAAISMAMDHNLPIRVFNLLGKNNIKKIVKGDDIGTLISS